MRKLILAAILALPGMSSAQGAFGEVIGTVVYEDSMWVSNAVVQTETNGVVYKDLTDSRGRFRISAIPAGKYTFMIIKDEDTMHYVKAEVSMDGIENLETIVFKTANVLEAVVVTQTIRLLNYGVHTDIKITASDIKHCSVKFDMAALVASMSSEVKQAADGQLIFRGARKGDMVYMIDGVKTNGVYNIPSAAIAGVTVYTGGIPAKYGDTTGGVVVMETKSYFDLYREWKIAQD